LGSAPSAASKLRLLLAARIKKAEMKKSLFISLPVVCTSYSFKLKFKAIRKNLFVNVCDRKVG
jgi:hypothetical protein